MGRGGATMYAGSRADADCIVIEGSNMAECHPVAYCWVMQAKEKGAKILHVDPGFTRTSATADVWAPVLAGSDIAFLGGLIRYMIEDNRYFPEYVVNYTNAATIITDTNLLGLLFLLSGASTGAVLMILLNRRRGAATADSVRTLSRLDDWIMGLELVALVAVVVSLGAVAQAWFNQWGILLVVGVVLLGILLPLALHWRHLLGRMSVPAASILVLMGGFILRAVVVLSSEAIKPYH